MKKLSLKNLKFEANEVLQRNQLKTVVGGGQCAVFVRLPNGSNYWSACVYSVSYAQQAYATAGDPLWGGYGNGGYRVTGYCCASCHHC